MANQWGRDGNSGGQGGSAASIIITGVLALMIGLGGGYAGARLLTVEPQVQPKPVSPPVSSDGPLYKLYQDALKQREDAMRDAAELRMELVQLKSRAASVEAEMQALRNKLSGAQADSAAEEVLHRQIEAQAAELARAKEDLATLKSGNARLAKQREQALREAGALKLRLTDLTGELNERTAAKENLELHSRQTGTELDALRKSSAAALAEKDRLAGALAKAEREIERLNKAIAETATAPPETPDASVDPGLPEETSGDPAGAGPRDPDLVTDALARAPGLKPLSFSERQRLAEMLEKGACVTDALEDIFVRVPVLTLRSLIRDLDSPC